MKLSELIKAAVEIEQATEKCRNLSWPTVLENDPEIRGIFYRAQEVTPGGMFVAIKGLSADGHDFIGQAIERGAAAIVCQRSMKGLDAATVTVQDTRKALALLAAAYHQHPSASLIVIGITGTNGKTTTTYLIENLLEAAGYKTGVIGTINCRFNGRIFDNRVTTPESLDLQCIMADMRNAGVTHVVMEVSSHALDLDRIYACDFDIGVFTNFTQDHLDYHKDMESYWACKLKLFTDYLQAAADKPRLRAVINAEAPKGRELARVLNLPHLKTGRRSAHDVQAISAQFGLDGIMARIQTSEGVISILSSLVGRHNLENILNAVGVGIALDLPLDTISSGIQSVQNVPGRLERVLNNRQRYVYVDYAHTPDALENTLLALRGLTADRIICVFGCGGDRDRAKRPQMGAIASRLSDLVVVTSDNPRTEAPDRIISEILAGIQNLGGLQYAPTDLVWGFERKGYVVEADRRRAIGLSIQTSRPGDTILIAGKGHESYQIIGHRRLPFDDRHEARLALSGRRFN